MRFSTLPEWLAWQETLHPKAIDLGLSRVREVAQRLELTNHDCPTITVGGTNGKGSTVAILDSILRAAGFRVGAYTSPHLLRYNERIRIAGELATDEALCDSFGRIDSARGDITLSFFEFGTLAALDLFQRARVDIRLLEVGLGGRLDAVNLVDSDVAVIAVIDLDHEEWLGPDREAIGREKAGIFRGGRPAIVGDPAPPQSIAMYAKHVGARLSCIGSEFGYRELAGAQWDWFGGGELLSGLPRPALEGQHQLGNAATAIAALKALGQRFPVSVAAVRRGLTDVRLAGRFQLLAGKPAVLFDVAHNPQSVGILAGYLKTKFAGKRIHAVFAVMRDKDVDGILRAMDGLVAQWYLPALPYPRAATPEEVANRLAAQSAEQSFSLHADPSAAYREAIATAAPDDMVVVFGSFFLMADCLRAAGLTDEGETGGP